MLAAEPACACNVRCRAQRCGDDTSDVAMFGRVPVISLVLNFEQGGLPAYLRLLRQVRAVIGRHPKCGPTRVAGNEPPGGRY